MSFAYRFCRYSKKDRNIVFAPNYVSSTEDETEKLIAIAKEEKKPDIEKCKNHNLQFNSLTKKVKSLIERKISPSEQIQELINDSLLQKWVEEGQKFHIEGEKDTCAFCGNILSPQHWVRLKKHFNQEYNNLKSLIRSLMQNIEDEISSIEKQNPMDETLFYAKYKDNVIDLIAKRKETCNRYSSSLNQLIKVLKKRKDNPFVPIDFVEPKNFTIELDENLTNYDKIRKKSNEHTDLLTKEQDEAKNKLRQNEVFRFLKEIDYTAEKTSIDNLNKIAKESQNIFSAIQKKANDITEEISNLRSKLKDEGKGARRVDELLKHFFGHDSLTLSAVLNENPEDDNAPKYRFEIMRGKQKAYHLSEGECSLMAFCYFIAKLEDTETENITPIIWIDDPISSLDSNHVFFVYALLRSEIFNPQKFKQIFISTHNLDFLKYLKRLNINGMTKGYFMTERDINQCNLSTMPRYLKEYVTEFNYLFHQIYKCAHSDTQNDENYNVFYNFGNNARKFIEIYLSYKYPDAQSNQNDKKLAKFFGDSIASSLTERFYHEYSHLSGSFERGQTPVNSPEIKKIAVNILQKIKAYDIDQYASLIESIGETEDNGH